MREGGAAAKVTATVVTRGTPEGKGQFPRGELLLACAVALALRLIYLAGAAKSPLFLHPQFDSLRLDALGRALAHGHADTGAIPGARLYACFLAAIYALAGHNLLVPRLVQAVVDVGSICLLSATAHAMWGRRAASLTADVAALYGPLIYFQSELSPATLSFFLVAATLYFTVRAARAGSRRGILLAGLALSFAVALAIRGGDAGAGAGDGMLGGGVGAGAAPSPLVRVLEKMALAWSRREVPCDMDQRFFAAFNSPLFRLPWLLSFALVGSVALCAAWVERKRAPLLAGFLACVTAAVAVFHVCDRTRLPLLAAAIPLAGRGIDRFIAALSGAAAKGRPRPAALAEVARGHVRTLIALGCAAALVASPFPRLQRSGPGAGWYALARAYESAGDPRAARDAYASAERLGMKSPDFYADWGILERNERSGVQAEQHLLTAINLDTRHSPAHEALGMVYFERGWFSQAGEEYAIAAGLLPARAAELFTRAGEAFEEGGNLDRAASMFERALRERPGYGPAGAGLERVRGPAAPPERVKMFRPLEEVPALRGRPNPPSGR